MADLPLVKAKLHSTPGRLGFAAYWIVDEQGRQLHTEPVCLVPEHYHEWFKQRLADMEFEYYGLTDTEEEDTA